MTLLYANYTASISELKKSPTALLKQSHGQPVAVLNHNVPSAYLVPAKVYEAMMEKLEDLELAKTAGERMADGEETIAVTLDEL